MKKTVVIMGAGPAGLTAALELLRKKKKYNIIIIEKDKQVGGISQTKVYKNNRIDLGGHRFFTKSQRVQNFWESILNKYDGNYITNQSLPNTIGDNLFLKRRRVSRIYYDGQFFNYPLTINSHLIKTLGYKKTFKVAVSYCASQLFPRPNSNLENFYINRFGKELYNTFFKNYTYNIWGKYPEDISASWGAQRVKGVSIKRIIQENWQKKFNKKYQSSETSLIETFYYPKYGPGQMWEQVQKELETLGAKILLNHEIVKIYNKNNKILSIDCLNNNKIINIKGDIFFSSIDVQTLTNKMSQPDHNILKITSLLPYRAFVNVSILVKKLELKNNTDIKTYKSRIPDCWLYIHEKDLEVGRIQILNNWSPYLVKDFKNTMLISLEYFCDENDERFKRSTKQWQEVAKKELVKLGFVKLNNILSSTVTKVKKAYPAYFGSYKDFEIVKNYLKNFTNLYCIGRNGQHRYNNMDHSMLTAMYAIDHLLDKSKTIDDIWNVNTEEVYHEEK